MMRDGFLSNSRPKLHRHRSPSVNNTYAQRYNPYRVCLGIVGMQAIKDRIVTVRSNVLVHIGTAVPDIGQSSFPSAGCVVALRFVCDCRADYGVVSG